MSNKNNRRQQILETLASELEMKSGSRITTAGLAAAVGVSEAALYRHFASKAQMFEALIEFAEGAIFNLFAQIIRVEKKPQDRCFQLVSVLLRFAERNPGIVRVLVGDILVGEDERLRIRASRLFARIETQFKQVLRERNLIAASEMGQEEIANGAQLLLSVVLGRFGRFVGDNFKESPVANWPAQWEMLNEGLFKSS
jgi:TetR/AcrR family transcriptional regulator